MNILSIMPPDKFSLAVCMDDAKAISKAQGVGAKTAARIILELKDKVSKDMMTTGERNTESISISSSQASSALLSEATEALMVLGYDKNTVLTALRGIDTNITDVGEIIKLALKKLAR